MPSVDMQRGFVSGGGGGPDAGPGVSSAGAAFRVYRVRGVIDANENRVPNDNDLNVAVLEPLVGYDAFMYSSAGTPASGVTGAGTVNAADFIVYLGGDPTLAASWFALNRPDYTASLPNCPDGFIRVVGERGASADAS